MKGIVAVCAAGLTSSRSAPAFRVVAFYPAKEDPAHIVLYQVVSGLGTLLLALFAYATFRRVGVSAR